MHINASNEMSNVESSQFKNSLARDLSYSNNNDTSSSSSPSKKISINANFELFPVNDTSVCTKFSLWERIISSRRETGRIFTPTKES